MYVNLMISSAYRCDTAAKIRIKIKRARFYGKKSTIFFPHLQLLPQKNFQKEAPSHPLPSVEQGAVLPSLRDRVTFSHSSWPIVRPQRGGAEKCTLNEHL